MNKQAEAASAQLTDVMFKDVYLPRFKQACAQQGIEFPTDEDLVAGLETAMMLKTAEAQLREQGVETRPSFFKESRDLLKQAMFGRQEEAPALDGVKKAMANLIQASKAAPATESK